MSPESSEGASLLADEDDVGRPHIEELPRIEEKMFARGNNWNESLNQYYCDIIDMEQHFILFDRLSRKERWYILKVQQFLLLLDLNTLSFPLSNLFSLFQNFLLVYSIS